MKTQIIVNRINDWFRIDDLELNIYMLSMRILLKLTTRRHAGLAYDRVNLAMGILNRTSIEAIETLDKAIVLLVSRKLIVFDNSQKNGVRKIFITDLGLETVNKYRELMENVD
ncbi:hypothetical protein ACTNCE_13795 [Dorea longicatena]|uniref:hypothetical protein n=1 Tax=Lachnospiraceae TaxID=186803 RepID=UPI003F89098B